MKTKIVGLNRLVQAFQHKANNQGITCGSTGIDALHMRISGVEKKTDAAADRGTNQAWFNDSEIDKYHIIVFRMCYIARAASSKQQ